MGTSFKPTVLYSVFNAEKITPSDILDELASANYTQEELNQFHRDAAEKLGYSMYELEYDGYEASHGGEQHRLHAVFTGKEVAERFSRLLNIRFKRVTKQGGSKTEKFEIRHGRIKNGEGLVAGENRKKVLQQIAAVPFFEIQTAWLNRLSDGTQGFNLVLTPRWPKSDENRRQLQIAHDRGCAALSDGDHRQILVDTEQTKLIAR